LQILKSNFKIQSRIGYIERSSLSHTHTHTHSLTHTHFWRTPFLSHKCILINDVQPLSISCAVKPMWAQVCTHTNTHLLSLILTHTHSHTHTHTLTHSHTHTHTLTHALTLSQTLAHTYIYTHNPKYTHAHMLKNSLYCLVVEVGCKPIYFIFLLHDGSSKLKFEVFSLPQNIYGDKKRNSASYIITSCVKVSFTVLWCVMICPENKVVTVCLPLRF